MSNVCVVMSLLLLVEVVLESERNTFKIAGDLNNRNILEFVVKLMLFATDTGSIELVASAGSSWECAIG
jgi:hypothetical protein